MDGRGYTVILLLLVPGALLGVTVWKFAANPLAIFLELVAMLAGAFYLVSYTGAGDGSDAPA